MAARSASVTGRGRAGCFLGTGPESWKCDFDVAAAIVEDNVFVHTTSMSSRDLG